MVEIAKHLDKGPTTLNAIAEKQNLSEGYLEQLVIPLKKAGLLRSIRGAQGGYVLARKADEIRVGDVVRALEGPISPVACVSEDFPEECGRAENCPARIVWTDVRDKVAEVLDSYTLQDLIQPMAHKPTASAQQEKAVNKKPGSRKPAPKREGINKCQ